MKSAAFLTAVLVATSILPTPAGACSFSWKRGYSPREIQVRSDIRRVEGIFRVVETHGQRDSDGFLEDGMIHGTIETPDGKRWDTIQSFSRLAVDCVAYPKPVADAKGVFWIKRVTTQGRHELMLWDGEHFSEDASQAQRKNMQKAKTK